MDCVGNHPTGNECDNESKSLNQTIKLKKKKTIFKWMKIVFQSKNNSNKTFKMVSRREEKKKRRVSLMWKIAFISIWVREGMFWVRCLIRFHNKSHRRNCMSIRRQLTVYYSWMGFTWCFIIIVENSGIFFFWAFFMRIYVCLCVCFVITSTVNRITKEK